MGVFVADKIQELLADAQELFAKAEGKSMVSARCNLKTPHACFCQSKPKQTPPLGTASYPPISSVAPSNSATVASSVTTPTVASNPTVTSNTTVKTSGLTLADTFRKGVKIDADKFPNFKDETTFNDFKWRAENIAKLQGACRVLDVSLSGSNDPRKLPAGQDEDLHQVQNDFMFAMFMDELKTTKTKEMVKEQRDGDARQLWHNLIEHQVLSAQSFSTVSAAASKKFFSSRFLTALSSI